MTQKYRFDIEGLRAIAIVGVLLFHINPFLLTGGFLGVDIFFVISGYLITDHIMRDLNNGTFRLRVFYLKRVRRLYPALFVMLAATSIAVCCAYLPPDTAKYGMSLISSTIYLSNIYFYTQNDYFNRDLDTSPLLHTWSLSVEEQFYLFFPLLMILCFSRFRNRLAALLAVLFIVSLGLSELFIRLDKSAAFFISPMRFWQLLAGGLIVFMPRPAFVTRLKREGLVALGLVMIAGSMLLFSGKTPLPGILGAIPTLGAAMVIYAGQQGLFMSRLLSIAPARFFGRISYSLYLWHWPILAVYRYRVANELQPVAEITLLAVCIAAGYLSWRFIEKPTKAISLDRLARLVTLAALCASVIGVAAGLFMAGGIPGRYAPEVQKIASYTDYKPGLHGRKGVCFITSDNAGAEEFRYDECLKPVPGVRNILLMGDSHAAHLYEALRDGFPDAHIAQATSSGCRPVLKGKGEKRCTDLRERMFGEFIPANQYDVIILSARWKDYEAGAVADTVRFLAPYTKTVVVSGPVIEYALPLARLIAFSRIRQDGGTSIDAAREMDKVRPVDDRLKAAMAGAPGRYFSALDALCPGGTCKIITEHNVPVQWDYGHLTEEGAGEIINAMKRQNLF